MSEEIAGPSIGTIKYDTLKKIAKGSDLLQKMVESAFDCYMSADVRDLMSYHDMLDVKISVTSQLTERGRIFLEQQEKSDCEIQKLVNFLSVEDNWHFLLDGKKRFRFVQRYGMTKYDESFSVSTRYIVSPACFCSVSYQYFNYESNTDRLYVELWRNNVRTKPSTGSSVTEELYNTCKALELDSLIKLNCEYPFRDMHCPEWAKTFHLNNMIGYLKFITKKKEITSSLCTVLLAHRWRMVRSVSKFLLPYLKEGVI